jgi:hypothetical protein
MGTQGSAKVRLTWFESVKVRAGEFESAKVRLTGLPAPSLLSDPAHQKKNLSSDSIG